MNEKRKSIKNKYKKIKEEYKNTQSIFIRVILALIKSVTVICTSLITLIIIFMVTVFIITEPYVKEARETSYDKLKNIDADYFKQNTNTTVYDKDNNIIGEINNGAFIYVSIKDISDYITEGYIAVEDKNFKSHIGVDFSAITRAGLSLIKNKGNITQGGSTITQQLVKNNILTDEKSYKRKLAEAIIAIDLEARPDVSKADIMEWYVNTNFYGNNNYGIESACSYYFNKTAKDVTPAEAAILIGISNAPTKYNPVTNYNACITNARYIIKIMYDNNVITENEYNDAIKAYDKGITIIKHRDNYEVANNYMATYAIECATKILMEQNGFIFKYIYSSVDEQKEYDKLYSIAHDEAYNKIKTGGYQIYTSFDSEVQNMLQESIDNGLNIDTELQNNSTYALQGAAVCIDNETNYIIAMVGGRTNSGEYNRGYQMARQPGSSIKPILDYAPAFDTGRYTPGTFIEDSEIKNGPNNWYKSYWGNLTIRYAMEQSINTIAYKTLYDIGVNNGLKYLADMNFSKLDYTDTLSPIVSIGGFTNGVTVDEMGKAYNTLENKGKYSDRTCIKSITSQNDIIYSSIKENCKNIYTEDTAYMITDCLKGVVTKGTGKSAGVEGQIIAGKTGTTNEDKDSWFCGYSKYYTCAFWTGYDTPKSLTAKNNIPSDISSKLFSDFMEKLHNNKDNNEKYTKTKADFTMPETIINIDGDIISTINNKDLKRTNTDIEYIAAQKAITEYESFSITSVENAKKYEEIYNNTMEIISKITDEYLLADINKRFYIKTESLNKQYSAFKTVIDKETEIDTEKEKIKNMQDEESAQKAAKDYQDKLIADTITYYIDILNKSSSYGDTEKQIDINIQSLLAQIKDSNYYMQLRQNYDTIVKNIKTK